MLNFKRDVWILRLFLAVLVIAALTGSGFSAEKEDGLKRKEFCKIKFSEGLSSVAHKFDRGIINKSTKDTGVQFGNDIKERNRQISQSDTNKTAIKTAGRFTKLFNTVYSHDPSSEFKFEKMRTDQFGLRHIIMEQYYKGIKVLGGSVTMHIDTTNEVYLITGEMIDKMNISTESAKNAEEIQSIILVEFPDCATIGPLSFIIVSGRLAYYGIVWNKNERVGWDVYVDAKTGEVLSKMERVFRQSCAIAKSGPQTVHPRDAIWDHTYNGVAFYRYTLDGNSFFDLNA
ncbi:MAG: hypothetical protein PHC61_11800, partial [Chitinivibrionales bacterium]|nr:hypothetical protein [Chitinivibrionales bacterium]